MGLIPVQIMGMQCAYCKKLIGGLTIPVELELNTISRMFRALKIFPKCNRCIESDPAFTPADKVKEQI